MHAHAPFLRCRAAAALLLVLPCLCPAQPRPPERPEGVRLPNGWSLTPAGRSLPLGDFPLNAAVSPDGRWMAVTNNGVGAHTLDLVDLRSFRRTDSVDMGKGWYGLAFNRAGDKLYASGGHDNRILTYAVQEGRLTPSDIIPLGKPWPNAIGTAGLALEETRYRRLFVVTKEAKRLFVFDLADHRLLDTEDLGAEAYTCLVSRDGQTLYVSLWGGGQVLRYDIGTMRLSGAFRVGDHPGEMALSRSGRHLFVANAQDNTVSIIDLAADRTVETLDAAVHPGSLSGSTTNGIALDAADRTLYIANADNNCLAAFDVSTPGRSRSLGFIPTGWYPTAVRLVKEVIYVLNGKGMTSLANPYGPSPVNPRQTVTDHKADSLKPRQVQYIGSLFQGTLSAIPRPDAARLQAYTAQVMRNTPYRKALEREAEGMAGNPVPRRVGDPSPIKHVFYIIKENRTYDQVLGDMPGGDGDTSLLLFGENITPNQHRLARDFVLLDHFFVDGEVSADGHNWSMGAYANDYVEKNWPANYGGKGGTHGTSGTLRIGNNRDGFIWDLCARHGVSFRNYGCFTEQAGLKPRLDVLKGHTAAFHHYDLKVADTTRFRQWRDDFDALVAAGRLPALHTIRLGNDHTEGLRAGRPTPFAHVADNDLAIGLLVEHLSRSPVWKESVVFILEDDAQNGPDHIDAHRSTAYLAGPFVKRGHVDHTPYTTSGMLRTIELILGLPPMTQYDAAATPMWRCFTPRPDTTPFTHLPARIDLDERNPDRTALAERSAAFDWDREDAVPDLIFNDILWMGLKGGPAPSPRRAAYLRHGGDEEERWKRERIRR
jgi:DNA-binding beta-propeller fold protein YncE